LVWQPVMLSLNSTFLRTTTLPTHVVFLDSTVLPSTADPRTTHQNTREAARLTVVGAGRVVVVAVMAEVTAERWSGTL
jgi:hypothetical protein